MFGLQFYEEKRESYRYILTLKNWFDWISTRWEKMLQPRKCTFWKKWQEIDKKKRLLPNFMTTFHMKTSWAKSVIKWCLKKYIYIYI